MKCTHVILTLLPPFYSPLPQAGGGNKKKNEKTYSP